MNKRNFAILATLVAMVCATPASAQPSWWVPTTSDTFQWDLEEPVDTSVPATVYDIDWENNSASVVQTLHSLNRHVVCYVDVGTWESYRSDAKDYPPSILGKKLPGYPQERFVDIRALDKLGPILQKRFETCKTKGFDAVEPDNMDTYTYKPTEKKTGFPLTAKDEIAFITWFVVQVHGLGMSILQKNDPGQTDQVQNQFDFALLEQCAQYGFCKRYELYHASSRAVFDTEYYPHTSISEFQNNDCPIEQQLGYYLILKKLSLNPWIVTCSGSMTRTPQFGLPRPALQRRSPP
jgi:hypothetical protein